MFSLCLLKVEGVSAVWCKMGRFLRKRVWMCPWCLEIWLKRPPSKCAAVEKFWKGKMVRDWLPFSRWMQSMTETSSLNLQFFFVFHFELSLGMRVIEKTWCISYSFYRLALSLCSREVAVLCHGCEFSHTPQKPPHSHSALQLQILWDWGSRWWVFC